MLTVDQYNYIRTAYRVYGKKIRQIAWKQDIPKTPLRRPAKGIQRFASSKPIRSYMATIEQWLEADKKQPKKQRHTARGSMIGSALSITFLGASGQFAPMCAMPGGPRSHDRSGLYSLDPQLGRKPR
jgi:hypothetical protein